jgi:dTDP-4-dehydrorhamnose 3,5-epimerase
VLGSTPTTPIGRNLSSVEESVMSVPEITVHRLEIPELMVLELPSFPDARGLFMETFNERVLKEIGIDRHFVQDNHSISHKNVLRGLHYQNPHAQGKLIRVVAGTVFDVAVDVRSNSRTFGKHCAITLSAEDRKLFWIPEGFAHGFLALSDSAELLYKASDYYTPDCERCIVWNDPDLNIHWPIGDSKVIVSSKDSNGILFRDSEYFK